MIFILIDASPGANKDARSWSWQRQLIGPVETLLSVRSSSQTARDAFELKQALEMIGGRPTISFLYTTKESTCTPNPEKSPSAYLQPDESDPLSFEQGTNLLG